MNDDTDGRNKAITGVCRRRFVKKAGLGRRAFVLQPHPPAQGLDFSLSPLQPLRPRESGEHFLEALKGSFRFFFANVKEEKKAGKPREDSGPWHTVGTWYLFIECLCSLIFWERRKKSREVAIHHCHTAGFPSPGVS